MERSILKNRGKELFSTTRKNGEESINRVTRYDIFIINHNASTHDPSEVLKEHSTKEREPRKHFYYFQAHRETAALCSPIIPGEVEKWELAIARSRDMGSKRDTRLPRQECNRRWPGKSVPEARSGFRMVTQKAIKIRSTKKNNYYTKTIALNKVIAHKD